MQSLETLRNLATLDRELIEQHLRTYISARARADLDALLKCLSPAISITIVGDPDFHPYAGRYDGFDGVRNLMRRIDVEFIYLESEILDIVIDQDRAVARRVKLLRQNGTGEIRRLDMCCWARFDQGLICEIFEYTDTALTAALAAS